MKIFDFFKKITLGKSIIDIKILDKIEELLITSDIGIDTTVKIINNLENRIKKEKYTNLNDIKNFLNDEISKLIISNDKKLNFIIKKKPYIILIIGVNGVGKTTTIGKISNKFKEEGKKVILCASDTYRFGAINQLKKWASRVDIPIIYKINSNPSSIVYDAIKIGISENFDIIIIDTAGRLHTNINLMNELLKIKKVIKKIVPEGPHETILVLDGTIGQNSFIQVEKFMKIINIDSITITKLDGTSKGGFIIGIIDKFKIPIKYITTGENINDLHIFNSKNFINNFLGFNI